MNNALFVFCPWQQVDKDSISPLATEIHLQPHLCLGLIDDYIVAAARREKSHLDRHVILLQPDDL